MKGEKMTGRVGRMDGMDELVEFLLARIAEDEHRAECAAMEIPQVRESGEVWGVWIGKKWYQGSAFASHIDHWMPARVLAECDAKRRIVEAHRMSYADAADETWARNGRCDECGAAVPCQTLRLLALPYADHEGFRSEWRA